jgi:long-subunit fatty acid transport protein
MKRLLLISTLLIAFACSPAFGAKGSGKHWWFGGGLGMSFGDVTFISVEPVIGYKITPKMSVGGRLIFRYREDERYEPEISTNDYGAGLFLRYMVARPFFVQGEYEYIDYEVGRLDGSSDRQGYDSLFGGFGVSQPIGSNTSFYASILYNFLWKDDEPSPYAEQWVFRVGVGVSF